MPNIHISEYSFKYTKGRVKVDQNELKNKIEIKKKLKHFKFW